MPATEAQRRRFRTAVGDTDETKFTDEQIDDLFDDVSDDHPDGSSKTLYAAAVVAGFESLLAQAAERVSYQQNESQEDLSDLTKNYEKALKYWSDKLNGCISDDIAAAASSNLAVWRPIRSQTEKRSRRYPDA
jgi:hypothetical protein